jgi:putative phosphoesterase
MTETSPLLLGVLSDTHGNRKLMHEAATLLIDRLGATVLFHLGDDYGDGAELNLHGCEVRCVPGLWCAEYHEPRIANVILEDFGAATVAAAHAAKDLRARELGATVILSGHTHEARIEVVGRSLHVNPGHLKARSSRGERASFATVSIEEGRAVARIHELSGAVRVEQSARLEDKQATQ